MNFCIKYLVVLAFLVVPPLSALPSASEYASGLATADAASSSLIVTDGDSTIQYTTAQAQSATLVDNAYIAQPDASPGACDKGSSANKAPIKAICMCKPLVD